MSRLVRPALLLVLVAALAVPAGAHVSTFTDAKTLQVGPYSASLDPQPSPLYANTALSFSALVLHRETGGYQTRLSAVILNVTGPGGFDEQIALHPDGRGYYVGSMLLPHPGNHTARLEIDDGEARHEGVTWFDVYPDLPFRIRAANSQEDVFAGRTSTMTIEIVDRAGEAYTDLQDLTLHVELWKDDHSEILASRTYPMTATGPNLWSADVSWEQLGMYHLRFSSTSGGFAKEDVPLLHLYAIQPLDDEPTRKPAPAPVALLLLALAGVALARRR